MGARNPISRTFPYIKLCLCTIRWGYRQLHALFPSTFLDFCWFLVDELGFIGDATQVPPWLSNDVAESCCLIVNDTLAVLMVKEGTSLVFAWKLHLRWLRDVFLCPWLFMIPWDTVDRPPLIDDILLTRDCTPWCSGISLSWFLLSTCESVSPKMIGADVF